MKNDFEHIASMTVEFQDAMTKPTGLSPDEAAYWQLRILLSIAQQLSVIAGAVKEKP